MKSQTSVGELDPSSQDQLAVGTIDGSQTILVVDDEPVVLRLCCTILEREGFQVLAANNGDEALKHCEGETQMPQLLLSDIIMPKLRGTELAERVARILPGIRILYMSGFDGREIPEYDSLRRSAKLLSKPFTPRDLVAAVRLALDKPLSL